jgi:hypothetical protein
MKHRKIWKLKTVASAVALLALTACGSDNPVETETRAQDTRTKFAPANPAETTFAAMAAAPGDVVDMATTSRWSGLLKALNITWKFPPIGTVSLLCMPTVLLVTVTC